MKRQCKKRIRSFEFLFLCMAAVSFPLCAAASASAQVSPEEHASHHPEQAGAAATDKPTDKPTESPAQTATPYSPASESGGGMVGGDKAGGGMMGGGGSGGGMGGMMEKMGVPAPKSLYPTLMSMSDVSPKQREEIASQADERINSSVKLLSTGLQRLTEAAEIDNYVSMHEATAMMHEALARLDSGLAARRAMVEDQPPQAVALQWFKKEMNLQTPQGVQSRDRLWGLTSIHLFSMVLLIAFALTMIGLYFVKMRRAVALFSRIESQKGTPPPGSAPALAGSAPPAGKS